MKRQKQWLLLMTGALAALTINSVTWAAEVPLDNRLDAWGDFGQKTIDFTDINISYSNGNGGGLTIGTEYFGESNPTSTFSLYSLDDGYASVAFNGYLVIDANISSKGVLRNGGTFGIYSPDAMFDGYETPYNCTKSGSCSRANLVYGGTLTGFGWSGTQGILEFTIGAQRGWAYDAWDGAPDQHIMLSVGGFDLDGVSSVKAFYAVADGFAVVDNSD